MASPLRIRAAIVAAVLLLIGAAIAVLHFRPDDSTVAVQLTGSELRLRFPRDCAIRSLRLGDRWAIGADQAQPLPSEVVVGTPPPGFQESLDESARPLPATISITAKSSISYGGEIALSALQDGARHDVHLSPIWNELSPASGLC